MHRDKCGAAAVAGFFQVNNTMLVFYQWENLCLFVYRVYSCNCKTRPHVCRSRFRHITETAFFCPTTSFWNPSFLIGFSQAEAQTSEGCGLYGHGEEQCRSRWAWPSFHQILHFYNFPDVGVFTCLLSDCYVADELVVSRAGRRVRVGNTDAEGRMVMVDLLCEMKEKVLLKSQSFATSFIPLCPNF